MPTVYRFRVTFEDYDEVTRDIEVKSTQFFSDLHTCIQTSIGFDNLKPSSFYMSNDNWIKGQEISTIIRKNKAGEECILMENARLCDFIADPHQKIYYLSDHDSNWTFRIELMKILPTDEATKTYPYCFKSTGAAPRQYIITVPVKTITNDDGSEEIIEDDDMDDEVEKEDSILGEVETGVDIEEMDGMGEEGEEDTETGDEEDAEMNFDDAEEDQKEDF
jgi:hypothetical protein